MIEVPAAQGLFNI